MEKVASVMLEFVDKNFAWAYLLCLPAFVIFLSALAISKYGSIVLGKDGEKPKYTMFQWCSMLFCGGTGIGLVFWSIAEPLSHYSMPPSGVEAYTDEAAMFSIRTCFLHWGLLQWAAFAVVGLTMTYFCYRKGKKFKISSMLEPVIGKRNVYGSLGKIIDGFSVVVSIAGIATSLGLGCMQITGGLNWLFGIPNSKVTYIAIIVLITALFTMSAVSGVNKGIKILSTVNAVMAFLLLALGIIVCNIPETSLTLVNGIGEHLQYFIVDSLGVNPYRDNEWVMNWRVFYFAWFVAWTPFVGLFFARISRGRTVREFIIGTVIVPTVFTWIWFAVFGSIAISSREQFSYDMICNLAQMPDVAVFAVFQQYKIGFVMSLLVVMLLATFFITSADSATYAIAMMSDNGNENPGKVRKIVFAIIESAVSLILLLIGGLKSLQTISIVAALPFLVIMVLMCISLMKEFKQEQGRK